MAKCPFCNGEITEALAAHGGTCPHCFGDVPGEEAATDPGEALRAKIQAEDRARAEAAARRPLLVAVPIAAVLLLGIGFAAYRQLTAPVVERLDFGDQEFVVDVDLAKYVAPPPGSEAAASPDGAGDRPVARRASVLGGAEGGSAEPEPVRPDGPGVTAAADGGLEIGMMARRSGAVLVSRDDLQAAVRDLFRTRAGRLERCLADARAAVPSLAGTWRLAFTLDLDGVATEVSATGKEMSDAGFESCLVAEMSTWKVDGKLEKPWPVSLPVNFRD